MQKSRASSWIGYYQYMSNAIASETRQAVYELIENTFREKLFGLLENKIALYCVTGSLGRQDIIPGWSDIDVLIIIDTYTPRVFEALHQALADNISGIKIGVSVFSIKEYNHTDIFFDPKSQFTLEMIKQGIYKPFIFDSSILDSLHTKKNVVQWFDSINLTRLLFELKRNLIDFNQSKERVVYKNIITIVKILVYRHGTMCLSYADTLIAAQNILHYPYHLPAVEDVAFMPINLKKRYTSYIQFVVWLEDSLYKQNSPG